MKKVILAVLGIAIVTFAAAQNYYTTVFPLTENPIVEGSPANWVNGLAQGTHWQNMQTANGHIFGTGLNSGCSGGNPNACNDGVAALTGTWTADQAACGTVFIDPTLSRTTIYEIEIHLHQTIAGGNATGYEFNYSTQSDANNHAPYMQIVRWDGFVGGNITFNVFNNVVNTPNPLTALVNGDTFCAWDIGGALKSWLIRAGAVVQTATTATVDTTYTGGAPGVGSFNQTGALGDNAKFGFSQFTATNLAAQTCSIADITTAWSHVTPSTGSFGIPPGTCDWSAGFHFNAPAGSTSLTIVGAGNTTGADSLGNPTGYNDRTTAQINSGTAGIVQFNASTSQTLFRVTGLTFQFLGSTSSCSLTFGGGQTTPAPTPYLRVDHSHFTTALGGVCLAQTFNASWGVVDHSVITMPVSTGSGSLQSVTNFWRVGAGYTGDGFAAGAYTWNQPTGFGTGAALYFENNFITGGYMNDCSSGGKQVFRYNTVFHSIEQGHEGVSDFMGCRSTEYYKNNVTCDQWNGAVASTRSGTMLVWGNTMSAGCPGQLIGLNEDRTNGHPFAPPPDWGYCGTGGVNPGPSPWDGNSLGSTAASGYPCNQQAGRGQGDLILGGAFGFGAPMRANVTLHICPTATTVVNGQNVVCPAGYTIGNTNPGGGSWARNALEPVYEWMDNKGQVGGDCNPLNCLPNRDYFQESVSQAAQSNPTTPFNGTAGDGHGTLANRPTTCTAGAGGQFQAGPPSLGGSPGVGYWDTGANTFYVCKATNTWAAYYTPYTYPHPFVSGTTPAGSVSISPSSENFGSITVGSSSSTQIATVTNTTTSAVTVTSVTTGTPGNNAADFPNTANTCSGTIPANTGSCQVTKQFNPSLVGPESATLTVNLSSGPLTVSLSGTGVSAGFPGTSYNPNPMLFGNVVVNQSKQLTLTITNTGTVTLTVSSNALGDTTVWTKNTGTCFPSGTVAPLATCSITVTFSPVAAINKNTTLTVTSNAPSSPDVINLSGSGILVPTTATGVILQGVAIQ